MSYTLLLSRVLPLVVLVCHAVVSSSDPENFQLDISTSQIETFHHAEWLVWHMEEDKSIQGNVLFSEIYRMKTTDGITTSVVIHSSNEARFFGFSQLNETLLVSTDLAAPCIRLIDRRFQNQTTYAGLCSDSGHGYTDGEKGLFNIAHGIILDKKDSSRLLVTDISNNAIREVDIASGNIGTFYKPGIIFNPKDIYQDSLSGDLFITTANSEIFILRYYSLTEQRISSASDGYLDGPIPEARFQQPAETTLINGRTALLVADSNNSRLRILDLITNTTSSICNGTEGYKDGDLENCTLYNPISLLIIAGTLYVGEGERIRKIEASMLTTPDGIDLNTHADNTPSPRDSSNWEIIAIAVPIGILIVIVSIAGFFCHKKKILEASTLRVNLGMNRDAEEEEYDEVDESAMEPDDYYLASIDYAESNDDESMAVGTTKPVPNHIPVINTTPCSSAINISTRELPFLPIPHRPSDWPYDYADSRSVKPHTLTPSASVHHIESQDSCPDYIDLPNKQSDIETISLTHDESEQSTNNTINRNCPQTNIIYVTDPTYVTDELYVTDDYCEQVTMRELDLPDQHENVSNLSSVSNEPTPADIKAHRDYAQNEGTQERIANLDTDQTEDLKTEQTLEQYYVPILDSGDHNSDSPGNYNEAS